MLGSPPGCRCTNCIASDDTDGICDCRDCLFNRVQRFVYFVAEGDGKRVKIGVSTDVKERVKKIRQAKADPDARLLGFVFGCKGTEKQWHKRLSAHHATGEWFWYNDEVWSAINAALEAARVDK